MSSMLTNKTLLFPKKNPPRDYEEVRSFFADILKKFDDVIALYEFGHVNNPGISDLDVAVVYKDSPADQMLGERIGQIQFSQATQDVIDGSTLMAFPERTFPSITLWDDLALTRLLGKEFVFEKFSPEREKMLDICRILDWLPERVLRLFRTLQKETIEVKQILGLLHSLRYTLRKVGGFCVPLKAEIEEFDKKITGLRAGWFAFDENQQRAQLAQAVRQAVSVACACTASFSRWLQENKCYRFDAEAIQDGVTFSFVNGYGYTFVNDISQLNWSALLNKDQTRGVWLPVPVFWAFHLREYAEAGGVIGEKLQRAFSVYPVHGAEINPELLELLCKRMALVNEWAEFLYRNHFRKGLFKFGWFY